MKTILRALQAVIIETIGVVIVLWALFGSAAWTLDSAGVEGAGESMRLTRLLDPWKGRITRMLAVQETPSPAPIDVEQRLDHYSQLYGEAAANYIKQVASNLATSESAASESNSPSEPLRLEVN